MAGNIITSKFPIKSYYPDLEGNCYFFTVPESSSQTLCFTKAAFKGTAVIQGGPLPISQGQSMLGILPASKHEVRR